MAGLPVFVATGAADAVILPQLQYGAVRAMCRYGNRIVWRKYDRIGHSGTSNFALRDAIPFARSVLAAKAPGNDCPRLAPPGPLQAMDPAVPFND